MQVKTIDAARGKWRCILTHFGMTAKQLSGAHGPCPICQGVDRYRFDDKGGTGSYFCSGCGPGYGIDLAMKITGLDFKEVTKQIDGIIGTLKTEPAKMEKSVEEIRIEIRRTLSQTTRLDEMEYLKSRGITSTPDVVFHPALEYWHEGKLLGSYPAMIGVVRDQAGNGVAIHRTYLKPGGKADVPSARKLSKAVAPLQGSAIRLYPATEILGVAEGIETACSASERFDMPVWSCINTTLLESFNPPETVKAIIVFGDHDANYAGQKAAYNLANRLALRGLSVGVEIPEYAGDWNDIALDDFAKETHICS